VKRLIKKINEELDKDVITDEVKKEIESLQEKYREKYVILHQSMFKEFEKRGFFIEGMAQNYEDALMESLESFFDDIELTYTNAIEEVDLSKIETDVDSEMYESYLKASRCSRGGGLRRNSSVYIKSFPSRELGSKTSYKGKKVK